VRRGELLASDIDVGLMGRCLYTGGGGRSSSSSAAAAAAAPELLVRTSGESSAAVRSCSPWPLLPPPLLPVRPVNPALGRVS
jgi:hypothetical protein